jgi:hypothetical protein
MEILKYFLGLEFAHSKDGININQCKYILDLLKETNLTNVKPAYTLISHHYSMYYSKK